MRRLMPLLAAAAVLLSTTAIYADLDDQLAKLLPDDGATDDIFGTAVAISGTTAIVGAPLTTTTAPTPAPSTSSTPARASRLPSSFPSTARRMIASASPSQSGSPRRGRAGL